MNDNVTVFPIPRLETEKTDETNFVGNEAFLKEVFGLGLSEVLPIVVSFPGNPAGVPGSVWFGRPWTGDIDMADGLPRTANNYFSLAVFRPDDAGRYRRQKARFKALCAVMLDDVGIKVPMERLTLAPSWLLETSPGNFQAGYLLGEPLADGFAADRLMDAIIEAGLCDPGANGPRARLARLPVAVNGKHSPPFRCRMAAWSPELRYSVEELVDGLQLEMKGAERHKRRKSRPPQERPADGDPVWIPGPDENAVLVALKERGLYKAPLGEGRHDITCPWVHEHTGEVDNGTAYFEPDDLYPIGGFKCLHGHCADRHIHALLGALGIKPNAARMKPTIRVVAGEMNRVLDAAERELAETGRHYQRGGLIVTVVTDPGTRETRIENISQPSLVRALARVAKWERYDARSEDWVRCDPPARHATVLYDSTAYPHLPVLNGLARQPYLRPDGSLMTAAGYDPATGMFGVFNAREFSVCDTPTLDQAREALALLKELLAEFRFAGESDLSAALAAILTAAIRPSLDHAPMFHVRAHMVGSGKSYLCELITAFATPQRGTPTTFPSDDEECRKLLLAELLRAPAAIAFDNLTGDLVAHKSLCTVLTSEFMSGRILGVSKTATVSTRTLFLSSGNNVGPVQDMTRRCISIHLDPGCETPAARTFRRPDLVREVLRERGRYVSAALTIVRAWISDGGQKAICKSLSGYGDWSDLCRQPLLWLGCADPTISVFEAIAEDPDRETLGRLLAGWQLAFGKQPAMVRNAVHQAFTYTQQLEELLEVIRDIAEERGEINRRKLGRWIKRHAGRIVDGRRFVPAGGNRPAEAWRVDVVESVSSVSSVSIPTSVKRVSAHQ
ncbi:hypothetical protein [Desulfococcus sp.]|uniref:hypothetical protein n=1 Tax=Desulfococcus sp. TaxID=2025834 RepID=UPI003593219F